MSEDEQRRLFARREELRLSALLEGEQCFAAKFDVMQREARRAAMKLTLAWRAPHADPGGMGTLGK